MRTTMAFGAVLLLAMPVRAADTPFTGFLRKSPAPVAVPGGTTTFVLDPTAPVASTPVAQSVSVVKNSSAALPAFTAPTFTDNVTLPIKIGATVHLSANLGMGSCAQIDANVLQIDPLGNATVAATVGAVDASVPQGSVGGTVGFATFRFDHPGISCSFLDGIPILEGGSVALQVVVTNNCDANRTVSLAYDAVTAPGEVDFVIPTKEEELALRNGCQQKCGTAKMTAAGRKATDRARCFEKAVQKTAAVDPGCLSKADLRLFTTFQNIETGGLRLHRRRARRRERHRFRRGCVRDGAPACDHRRRRRQVRRHEDQGRREEGGGSDQVSLLGVRSWPAGGCALPGEGREQAPAGLPESGGQGRLHDDRRRRGHRDHRRPAGRQRGGSPDAGQSGLRRAAPGAARCRDRPAPRAACEVRQGGFCRRGLCYSRHRGEVAAQFACHSVLSVRYTRAGWRRDSRGLAKSCMTRSDAWSCAGRGSPCASGWRRSSRSRPATTCGRPRHRCGAT